METGKIRIAEMIHHITTIAGFLTGVYYFLQKEVRPFAKMLLSFHIVSQGVGILKIISDRMDGRHRFSESFAHVTSLCEDAEIRKLRLPWILLATATVFKVGVPLLLGSVKRK